jgi:hypothetical protein
MRAMGQTTDATDGLRILTRGIRDHSARRA